MIETRQKRYMRRNKKLFATRLRDYRQTNPEKYKAHYAVNNAVQSGRLKPARAFGCSECGQPATEYHHDDYSKPLDIRPVCRPCNRRLP